MFSYFQIRRLNKKIQKQREIQRQLIWLKKIMKCISSSETSMHLQSCSTMLFRFENTEEMNSSVYRHLNSLYDLFAEKQRLLLIKRYRGEDDS